MPDRTNRRDQIVAAAAELFINQGYTATSVRQIAENVGCTEAALYYHFKNGKRELLQAVMEIHMPNLLNVLAGLEAAESLHDLIVAFGQRISLGWEQRMERVRWLIGEYPHLSADEQALFHDRHRAFQNGLLACVERFVEDPLEARAVTYTVICAMFGYGNLFLNLDVGAYVDFEADDLAATLAMSLAKGR